VNAPKDDSGGNDPPNCSETANEQRHEESAKGEFFEDRAENHNDNSKRYCCDSGAEQRLEREINFRRVQSRAEQAEREGKKWTGEKSGYRAGE
jgi:hypothetical protein